MSVSSQNWKAEEEETRRRTGSFFFFFFHVKDRLLTFTDVSDEVDVIADFLDSS